MLKNDEDVKTRTRGSKLPESGVNIMNVNAIICCILYCPIYIVLSFHKENSSLATLCHTILRVLQRTFKNKVDRNSPNFTKFVIRCSNP